MCLFAITAWSLPVQFQAAAYPGAFSHQKKALGSLSGWAYGVLSPRGGGTRFSFTDSPPTPVLIPHSSETCGRDMCQRPGPLRDGPAAPPGRAIGLAAIPRARGIPLAGRSEAEAGVPRHRQRGGPGQAGVEEGEQGTGLGPGGAIPYPASQTPYPASRGPSGAPRAVSVKGVPPLGGLRVGAGPPRAPPQGEREGPSPAPPGAPPLRYLAGTGSAAWETGGGRATLGAGLLGRGV